MFFVMIEPIRGLDWVVEVDSESRYANSVTARLELLVEKSGSSVPRDFGPKRRPKRERVLVTVGLEEGRS